MGSFATRGSAPRSCARGWSTHASASRRGTGRTPWADRRPRTPAPIELPPGVEPPRIVGGSAIEPEGVAQRVVAAVKNNDLYIVTHPDTREAVEARFGAILAAYDKLEASLAE